MGPASSPCALRSVACALCTGRDLAGPREREGLGCWPGEGVYLPAWNTRMPPARLSCLGPRLVLPQELAALLVGDVSFCHWHTEPAQSHSRCLWPPRAPWSHGLPRPNLFCSADLFIHWSPSSRAVD